MTASHVGNTGITGEDAESDRIQVAGFAARHFPERFSNARGKQIARRDAPRGGDGRHPRSRHAGAREAPPFARGDARRRLDGERRRGRPGAASRAGPRAAPDDGAALALEVGTRASYAWAAHAPGRPRVAALDYGIKRNILRNLARRGLDVTVFPATTPAAELAGFDGFFLSNGPGDPAALPACVATIRTLVETGKPLFGICLGHQLLGLALGARTFKLKFGHRGREPPGEGPRDRGASPSRRRTTASRSTPTRSRPGSELTHVNLNDGTCEGFRLEGRPVFAVQYHPESAPGPHDSDPLFDEFARALGADPGGVNVSSLPRPPVPLGAAGRPPRDRLLPGPGRRRARHGRSRRGDGAHVGLSRRALREARRNERRGPRPAGARRRRRGDARVAREGPRGHRRSPGPPSLRGSSSARRCRGASTPS